MSFNYSISTLENNAWKEIHTKTQRQLIDTEALDESLDTGNILIPVDKEQKPIPPSTNIKVEIKEIDDITGEVIATEVIYRLSAPTERKQVGIA